MIKDKTIIRQFKIINEFLVFTNDEIITTTFKKHKVNYFEVYLMNTGSLRANMRI